MELKRLKERQSANVYYLPNAANVALFRQGFDGLTKRPEELSKIPPERPIVLYMGNICQRLDYELLIKLAEAHPDKTLVMVGPRTNDSYRTSGLEKLPNVLFTGRKDIAQLPAFVAASACCIIPFLCIPLTRSIYPLKINEYLSGGKPVVTTNFSEDIATFAKVAFVTDTHERFIRCITEAIRTDSPRKAEERVAYAAENSWDARAQQLIDILGENIARNDEGGR
jgi:glycosyltransferase involved in cell wall biosynthesis